jgi:8-oxo-dGTP diphosphatase
MKQENINFRIAVKAFIVRDKKLLLLQRRGNDVHKPGAWDIPGGRLELGENPMDGLKREVLEETGFHVEQKLPLQVQHFTRDDGQNITMLIFLCVTHETEPKLSEEHQSYKWVDTDVVLTNFPEWLHDCIRSFKEFNLGEKLS